MFRIDNNMNIRISQGDDVEFPLLLNQGTISHPIRMKLLDGNKAYFYIFELNDTRLDHPIVEKVYTVGGGVKLYINGTDQYTDEQTILNDHGDLLLTLKNIDTINIQPTRYKYQVKILKDNKYYTVTNKNDIFIINDDYQREWQ